MPASLLSERKEPGFPLVDLSRTLSARLPSLAPSEIPPRKPKNTGPTTSPLSLEAGGLRLEDRGLLSLPKLDCTHRQTKSTVAHWSLLLYSSTLISCPVQSLLLSNCRYSLVVAKVQIQIIIYTSPGPHCAIAHTPQFLGFLADEPCTVSMLITKVLYESPRADTFPPPPQRYVKASRPSNAAQSSESVPPCKRVK